jgi:hypothetical protein
VYSYLWVCFLFFHFFFLSLSLFFEKPKKTTLYKNKTNIIYSRAHNSDLYWKIKQGMAAALHRAWRTASMHPTFSPRTFSGSRLIKREPKIRKLIWNKKVGLNKQRILFCFLFYFYKFVVG